MDTLKIEWMHLEKDGETCERCYDTGENLMNEIKRLKHTLDPLGIQIELIEKRLSNDQVLLSNCLLFNDIPIENIIDIEIVTNYCGSCSEILNSETFCRSFLFEDNHYDEVPPKAIRQAAYKSLNLEMPKEKTKGKSGCCGHQGKADAGGCCGDHNHSNDSGCSANHDEGCDSGCGCGGGCC